MLANVYLHYVFDLWAHQWRTRQARGDVVIVRFADDAVVGFEHREDAERFWSELRDRLAKFSLELNAEKTRLIQFGRFAAKNRAERGLGKPETFQFLGFTHICATTKNGRFKLKRITDSKRMRAKLSKVKAELIKRRDLPIPDQGRWLASVVRGHFNYYAVPDNGKAITAFRYRRHPSLAPSAPASQPATPDDLEADRSPRRTMATSSPDRASLAEQSASTPSPKAGAQCVSSARWDLCGGQPEPTGEGLSLPR